MFKTSESRKNLLTAILKAKKNFDPIIKDSTNPYFKSKYESLNGVLDAVETALNNEGINIEQPNSSDGISNFVTTRLEHVESGEFTESTLKLEKTNNMQEVGAASTYGRRQTLKGLLALKAEDDDGNAASGKKVEPQASKAVETAAKKGPGRPTKVAETVKTTTTVTTNGHKNATTAKPEVVLVQEDEW